MNTGKVKYPIEVALLVPPGLHPELGPWSILLLRDYLLKTAAPCNVTMMDLRLNEKVVDFGERRRQESADLLLTLKPMARRGLSPMGNVAWRSGIYNVAWAGKRFLSIADKHHLFAGAGEARLVRDKYGATAEALRDDIEGIITNVITEHIRNTGESKRVWGCSVANGNTLEVLEIARLIRKYDPSSTIILGGCYFDAAAARAVVEKVEFIDAAVVGPGEETLRRIVECLSSDGTMEGLDLPGLVTRRNLGSDNASSMSIPPSYTDPELRSRLSIVVSNTAKREIRLFPFRGCSWSRCAFCAFPKLGKTGGYSLLSPKALEDLGREVQNCADGTSIWVDSEENDPDAVGQILKAIVDNKGTKNLFLWLYIKVSRYRPQIGEALRQATAKGLTIRCAINPESFSPDILRAMKKGHRSLKAIEVIKSVRDAGASVVSNVMLCFPGYGLPQAAEDARIIEGARHLLDAVHVFNYVPNLADYVAKNPQEYGISVTPTKDDPWLEEMAGVGMPTDVFACRVEWQKRDGITGWTASVFTKAMADWFDFIELTHVNPRQARKLAVTSAPRRFGQWGLVALGELLSRDRSFSRLVQRTRTLLNVNTFSLRLDGRHLRKRFGRFDKWDIELTDAELDLLRYLYVCRSLDEVRREFSAKIGEQKLEQMLRRHISLGSILEQEKHVVCTANDPGRYAEAQRAS